MDYWPSLDALHQAFHHSSMQSVLRPGRRRIDHPVVRELLAKLGGAITAATR
jgi:hypothetical protein